MAVFLEAGGSATQGLELWTIATGAGGSPAVSTATSRNGVSSIAVPWGGNVTCATRAAINGNTGRSSAWVSLSTIEGFSDNVLWQIASGAGVPQARLINGALSLTVTGLSTSTGVIFTRNTWYRLSCSWTWTSSTSWTVTLRVYDSSGTALLGSATQTNANGSWAGPGGTVSVLTSGLTGGAGTAYWSDIYHDDAATNDDPGNISVTAKQAAALNTNNFNTLIGSATNRFDYISERPLSEANGIVHAAGTDVQENFGLQAAATGDANLTGATIVARSAWVWAKRGPVIGTGTPKATGSGAANSSGTTVVATLNAAVVTGDMVVVALADQMGGAAPTIASVPTQMWNALTGPTTNTIRCNKWYAVVGTGSAGLAITATYGSATASRALVAAAWDGTLVGILDKNIANANDSTSPYDCPTTGTLAQADELVLGFAFAAGAVAFAAGNGTLSSAIASTGGSATTNASVAISHRVVSATGAVAPQFTLGTSRTGVVGTASFKLITPVKVAGTPKLMDNGVETAVTLTETSALYTVASTTSTYPSNAAGIGMRSSGASGADTYLYECGTLVAYIPAVAAGISVPVAYLHRCQQRLS